MIHSLNFMKILLVANVAKEHVNKFHIPTIKCLQSHGCRVDIACSVDADIPVGDNIYHMSWKRTPFTFKTLIGIFELKALIEKNEYDLVYCHTPVGGLVARFATSMIRKKRPKVVYCAHGLHFYNGAPLLNWILYYPIERWMAKMTDMFITINHEDFERVKKNFNSNMQVRLIYGIGANFDRLNINNRDEVRRVYREQMSIPQNAEVLIYVAEIINNKNQQMLIRALNELHKKGRFMYLLLPGPDHSMGQCQKLAKVFGLTDFVKFLGWRNDIGQLMVASDLYVASSIREGFGINLVEAQYCHLPVVAVNNRGHRSVILDGENGVLIPMNDFNMMAEKVIEILDDNYLYSRYANINVDKYDATFVAQNIYRYLLEVVEV